jgi:hypothetical protein
MGSTREGGMKSLRRSLPALAGLLFAGVVVVSGASPALAAPPYPVGAQATALVGGIPLVQSTCPTAAAQPPATGNSTLGPVFVTGGGARCTGSSASADGQYAITGATAAPPTTLRFSSQCVSSTGQTGGLVDVPAGTNISGVGVVASPTIVTTLNTAVTYPNGTTAILNQVTTTTTSVTRNAIVITGGTGAGTVVGRVVCGTPIPYPLAVDAPGAGAPAPDLALTASDGNGGSSRMLYVGGAVALLILAQVAVGRSVWRRRRGVTGA